MYDGSLYPDMPKLDYKDPTYDEVMDAWNDNKQATVNQGKSGCVWKSSEQPIKTCPLFAQP